MKQIMRAFLIVLSLYTGVSEGQEFVNTNNSALDPQINPYRMSVFPDKKGLLERSKIVMGTILKSHHFSDDNFNETHNGIYLGIDNWSIGTFKNSGNVQSTFVTYNPKLYSIKSVKVNLVAGVADGYEGWDYAQGDYLPMLGVSAVWMNMRAMLSYDLVAFGLEVPLN